jgi:hypothetical protein
MKKRSRIYPRRKTASPCAETGGNGREPNGPVSEGQHRRARARRSERARHALLPGQLAVLAERRTALQQDLGGPEICGVTKQDMAQRFLELEVIAETLATDLVRHGVITTITDGVEPSLHVEYKSTHVKQYFKEQQALRTETTINNPKDFYVAKAVSNLTHLRQLGDQVNRKVLEVERVSQQCVLTQDALNRLQQPTVEQEQRTSAQRFGDARVMAVVHALTAFTHLPQGFRNLALRSLVAALLGHPYSAAHLTCAGFGRKG